MIRLPDDSYVRWRAGHPGTWLKWIKKDWDRWLKLPTRTANALIMAGFFDLDKVLAMPKEEILVIRGVGNKGYQALQMLKDETSAPITPENVQNEAMALIFQIHHIAGELWKRPEILEHLGGQEKTLLGLVNNDLVRLESLINSRVEQEELLNGKEHVPLDRFYLNGEQYDRTEYRMMSHASISRRVSDGAYGVFSWGDLTDEFHPLPEDVEVYRPMLVKDLL